MLTSRSITGVAYDYQEPEDAPVEEGVYGRCANCGQLDELGGEQLCILCEHTDRRPLYDRPAEN